MYERVAQSKENKSRATTNSITKNEHSVKQRFKFVNDSLGTKSQNLLQRKEISNSEIIQLCRWTKQQRDEHEAKLKAFQEAKKKALAEMPKKTTTSAFSKKHLVPPGTNVKNASKQVAKTRTWGGGKQAGTSTVVKMSAEDQNAETRFMLEGIKMSECDIIGGKLVPKMGVNKPTRFVYSTKSARVTSDKQGNRTIKQQDEKYGHPVLGLKGAQINHLHGIKDEE